MAKEKILTMNLRKDVLKVPQWKRSTTFMRLLKKRIGNKNISISESVNKKIWSRGGKKPPAVLRVKVIETDGKVKVELLE